MTKLFYINQDALNTTINNYISNGQRDALDSLPTGSLKARWTRRKADEIQEEAVNDIMGILATRDFLKKNNIVVN